MREVPLSRLCRESPLTPGQADHTSGSWWGWSFHPHRLPHGECGVWGRAPGVWGCGERHAWLATGHSGTSCAFGMSAQQIAGHEVYRDLDVQTDESFISAPKVMRVAQHLPNSSLSQPQIAWVANPKLVRVVTRATSVRAFFWAHNVRHVNVIDERIQAIKSARAGRRQLSWPPALTHQICYR